MVKDQQMRMLMKLLNTEKTLSVAASKSGMSEKTARKYKGIQELPSALKNQHCWETRKNPFNDVWIEVQELLSLNSGLESKTIFSHLQTKYPGKFSDNQLRTLQRHIKVWRGIEGPSKEVYFPQEHHPGQLSESDFTNMSTLKITIQKERFDHLIYHFVLTYSNWETGTICFSESYESLSTGIQNALWQLGGVPKAHKTDRLTAAVHKMGHPEEFTSYYKKLLDHYGLEGKKIQAGKPNENGDVEQSNFRFKKAVDQSLMLRGSRDFNSREEYNYFLRSIFKQLNSGRIDRFKEELKLLKSLPATHLEDNKKVRLKVRPSSTIRLQNNVYSVDSRLIGENVEIRIGSETLNLWYGQKQLERIPRIRGENKFHIQYRHIIDWLVRKPGAFENYRYRESLFPTIRFRIAYDNLKKTNPLHSTKDYLKILSLAAKESESGVDDALRYLINHEETISSGRVNEMIQTNKLIPPVTDVSILEIDISAYDDLLTVSEEVCHA